MRFTVVTIFPDSFESMLSASVLGRAREAGLISVDFVDPRDFTTDRHRSVDDYPYGGGPGMVMRAPPLLAAIERAAEEGSHRVLLAPVGAPFSQETVRELAKKSHIVLVCGRYEGIDERVAELAIDETISIGDFVLSGGEIGALAVIDAVARLVPGVLGEPESAQEESFSEGLLEYPQYTRPAEVDGLGVPEVLVGGNHQRIRDWRRQQSLARTAERRPDLILAQPPEDNPVREIARRTYVALCHHPVYDRNREVVTTALTNLDLHDIARSVHTYGLGGYWVVTPVTAQREKAIRIVKVWEDEMQEAGDRGFAVASVRASAAIEDVVREVSELHDGTAPMVVATTADESRAPEVPRREIAELRGQMFREPGRPLLILFGTGWGLTEETVAATDAVMSPIRGFSDYNHLAVRSAVAIALDRWFGRRAD